MSLTPMVVLVAVLAAVWWWLKRRSTTRVVSADDALLRACHGDRERADRLVMLEADREPGITRAEATRRALAAYRRDNH